MKKTKRTHDAGLVRAATPRLIPYIPHTPTPPQAAFLLLSSLEAFYGGAAGGGKSEALLMAALQYVDMPGYAALLVRESYQMLNQPGGLIDRARSWLAGTDATWNGSEHQWRFPSGATLTFRHLQDAGAALNFQGAEYQFIGIDEVTDLVEDDYRFLFSRLRRGPDSPVPLRMRAASNPCGPGFDWVHRRFIVEGRSEARMFIPARLEDNPHLDQDSYERSLEQLGSVRYRQLRHGDWTVHPEGGCSGGNGSRVSRSIAVSCRTTWSSAGTGTSRPPSPRRAPIPTTPPGSSWGAPIRASGTCATSAVPAPLPLRSSAWSPPLRSVMRPGVGSRGVRCPRSGWSKSRARPGSP